MTLKDEPVATRQKEFGKFTLEQLRQLAGLLLSLPHLQGQWRGLLDELESKLAEKDIPPFYWSTAYIDDFYTLIAKFTHLCSHDAWLSSSMNMDDPQQSVLDKAQNAFETLDDDLDNGPEPRGKLHEILGLNYALIKNLECIWLYGFPLNTLVAMASYGHDKSLFKAVRIDRSIVSCPAIAGRLAHAEMFGDTNFFKKLRNALNGKPKKPKDEYGPLRFILFQLSEDGTLDRLSIEERYNLLCVDLRLYSDDTKSKDPALSLDKYISRWKESLST